MYYLIVITKILTSICTMNKRIIDYDVFDELKFEEV